VTGLAGRLSAYWVVEKGGVVAEVDAVRARWGIRAPL
jgi:hypothetical protein